MMPSLPGALKDELGQGLSDLVESTVNDEDGLDGDAADRLSTLLGAYGSDSDVASSMYEDLGADGTVASLAAIDSNLYVGGDERLSELAADLRRTLATASQGPQFDSRRFGEDLTRYATWSLGEDRRDAYEDASPTSREPTGRRSSPTWWTTTASTATSPRGSPSGSTSSSSSAARTWPGPGTATPVTAR